MAINNRPTNLVSKNFPFTGTETFPLFFGYSLRISRVSKNFPFTGTETYVYLRLAPFHPECFKKLPLYGDGNWISHMPYPYVLRLMMVSKNFPFTGTETTGFVFFNETTTPVSKNFPFTGTETRIINPVAPINRFGFQKTSPLRGRKRGEGEGAGVEDWPGFKKLPLYGDGNLFQFRPCGLYFSLKPFQKTSPLRGRKPTKRAKSLLSIARFKKLPLYGDGNILAMPVENLSTKCFKKLPLYGDGNGGGPCTVGVGFGRLFQKTSPLRGRKR